MQTKMRKERERRERERMSEQKLETDSFKTNAFDLWTRVDVVLSFSDWVMVVQWQLLSRQPWFVAFVKSTSPRSLSPVHHTIITSYKMGLSSSLHICVFILDGLSFVAVYYKCLWQVSCGVCLWFETIRNYGFSNFDYFE